MRRVVTIDDNLSIAWLFIGLDAIQADVQITDN